MRRILSILLIFSALAPFAKARDIKFAYGLEWGLAACLYTFEANSFFTEEQFPVRTTWQGMTYHNNGHIWVVAGIDLKRKVNLSAYVGYQGIGPGARAYPVSLRVSYYFNKTDKTGFFTSLAGGLLLDEKFALKTGYTANIAGGYRIMLGKRLSLDFKAGLQLCRSHPREFIDRYTSTAVPAERVISSTANRGSVFAGIALNL